MCKEIPWEEAGALYTNPTYPGEQVAVLNQTASAMQGIFRVL